MSRLEVWANSFEPELRSALFWRGVVWVSSGALLVLIPFISYAPSLKPFFRLEPAVPLALIALRLAALWATLRYERVHDVGPGYFLFASTSMAFLFQLIASSLVVWSQPPGAFVLASIGIVAAAYSGLVLRATLRFPWLALAHAGGMAAALAMRPDIPHAWIFGVAAPLAVGSCLVLGSLAEHLARQRAALDEHRRAVEAQLLEEHSLEARRLASELFARLERNHDASSVLSTALLDADAVRTLTLAGPEGPAAAPEIRTAVWALRDELLRLARVLAPAPADDATEGEERARVPTPVLPAVRAVLADAARRFPGLSTSLEAPAGGDSVSALIQGGPEKLACLLAGLVANACQGDGARGAKAITVEVASEPEGAVSIKISDDGPGFASSVLEGANAAFLTTKTDGSGLGLYTAERLASASRGTLRVENRPAGGALVTLHFEAPEAAPA
jgi:two-component system, NtrC family, C4-dicarboxylate transport sensor histidine kinase DctB